MMKRFFKGSLKLLLSASIVLTAFVSQSFYVNAHPSNDITLPGGNNYDDYTIKSDSPISGGYAQLSGYKRRVDANPTKGSYISTSVAEHVGVPATITDDAITSYVQVSDGGYLVSSFAASSSGTGGNMSFVSKFDAQFNLISTKEVNSYLNNKMFLSLTALPNQTPGQSEYGFITQDAEFVYFDKDGNFLPALTKKPSIPLPPGVSGGMYGQGGLIANKFRGETVWVPGAKISTAYLQEFDANKNFVGHISIPKPTPLNSNIATNRMALNVWLLDNGNHILQFVEQETDNVNASTADYTELWLYDASFNPIKELIPVTNRLSFSVLSSEGNPLISYKQNNELILQRIDINSGTVLLEKTFSAEMNASFSSMYYPSVNSGNLYISGQGNPVGDFAGYATSRGSFIAELKEVGNTFEVVNANFIETKVNHSIANIKEMPGNPEKIIVYGTTAWGQSNDFDLFPHPSTGLLGGTEAFFGTFDQSLDYAPKLPVPGYINVRVNSDASATDVDMAMLNFVKKDMENGTNDLENHRLDDFTSNETLLSRVNKNVLNSDYQNTTIDWSKFGLTPIAGKNTYEVGPNSDVTFSVTDSSMLQTTISTLVNVLDENTMTDTEPDPENGNYAIFAKDIRVHVNNVAALDYLIAAQVKAWNLKSGVIETATVQVDKNNVQQKVGVYTVSYTYQGIIKENKVIVYDDDTTFGPKTDDPNDEDNTEMIYAVGGSYLPTEVAGKSLDQVTEYAAWDLTTGQKITTKTTETKDENNAITSYDGTKAGKYYVTYTLNSGTAKTVLVQINTGNIPVLTVNPKNISLDVNAAVPDVMAGVTATDIEDLDLTSAISNTGSVTTTAKGIYTINYSVTDSDYNTVTNFRKYLVDYVNIPVEMNNEAIVADDFKLTEAEAAALTVTQAESLAGAKAWSTDDGTDVTITNTDISQVQATKGVYDVVFATAKGTTITVKAVVGYVNPPVVGDNESIIADDFNLTSAEAAALTPVQAVQLAGAKAWEHQTGADVVITTIDISKVQATKGVYDVTFATAKGTTIAVKAVVDYVNPPVVGDNESIIADDFILTIDEAATLTTDKAVTFASAKAWEHVSGQDVAITTVDISSVQATKGVYDVVFATTKGTSITVKAIVDYTLPPVAGDNESIIADNFHLTEAEAATLTEAEAVTLAAAKAWEHQTGASVTITTVDISAVQATKGVYDVVFATAKGTDITVKAIVDYINVPIVNDNEMIIADNFSLTLEAADNLTENQAIDFAKAYAWQISDGSQVTITTVDISQVKPLQGYYPVTFTTAKGTTITVQAVVGENLIYYNIQGNDLTITLSELQKQIVNGTLEAYVLEHSNAVGAKTDISGTYAMPVSADVTQLGLTNNIASIPVELNINHAAAGASAVAAVEETEKEIIETNATVIVHVIDDADLPSTGTSELEFLAIGVVLLTLSGVVIIRRKK
ncbi:immunoglobulin-like domain-containing protein [Culicoidibacter larvae]|uniref:DUF5011 domain-containing protein n=1 Tax=Culicoidibacter larvae TaxID=2579976 RepID=A0A5R8Q8W2_9FIRM|nr:immunoglobulin-like domain-containing protein [Culicoidibacter larvae]TLG71749.1 DUF5011 domain-containing protein [Culicoidibacter larvae]